MEDERQDERMRSDATLEGYSRTDGYDWTIAGYCHRPTDSFTQDDCYGVFTSGMANRITELTTTTLLDYNVLDLEMISTSTTIKTNNKRKDMINKNFVLFYFIFY